MGERQESQGEQSTRNRQRSKRTRYTDRTVPKMVEHEARRAEVAQAAWRVILRDGVENVRIRDIADELGLTLDGFRGPDN
jgi:AcrR family transcriptional regulator